MKTSLKYIFKSLLLCLICPVLANEETSTPDKKEINSKTFYLDSYMASTFSRGTSKAAPESDEKKAMKERQKKLMASINLLGKNRDNGKKKPDPLEMLKKSREAAEAQSKNSSSKKSPLEMALESRSKAENLVNSGIIAPEVKASHTFEAAQKWVQNEFSKVSEIYGTEKSSKVINLFLIGNYSEFLSGLRRSGMVLEKLEKRSKEAFQKLDKEIKRLEKDSSFGNTLFKLLLDFSKEYQDIYADIKNFSEFIKRISKNSSKNKNEIFSELDNKLKEVILKYKKLKIKYHKTLMYQENTIDNIIKTSRDSYFSLKDLEITSDKFFTLLNSLLDLKNLASIATKPIISEDDAKKSLNLITLYSSILRRLKILEENRSNASKGIEAPLKIEEVTLPIGKKIEEFQYLMIAKNFIERFFKNPNDISSLQKILNMKRIFNNSLTSITINTTQGDPTFLIKIFDDSIIQPSSKVFSILNNPKYKICKDIFSFVGNDIAENDAKYGGCLSKTVYNLLDRNNAWYSAEYAANYIRNIDVKTAKLQEVVDFFMLINNQYKNLNPILSTAIRNRLKAKFKLIMDSYYVGMIEKPSLSENISTKKEESLVKFVANDIELGSPQDQKQIANSVAIKTLEKTCNNFINNFSLMIDSLETDIKATLLDCEVFFENNFDQRNVNNYENLNKRKLGVKEMSRFIDNKFKDYIDSNLECKIDDSQGNKTKFIFKVAKNTISEEDIKNMLYILTKNVDKVKSSSLHVVGTRSADNKWILNMVDRLKKCIYLSISKIDNLLNENESNWTKEKLKMYL